MNTVTKHWYSGSYEEKHRRAKQAWTYINTAPVRKKYGFAPSTEEVDPPSVGEREAKQQESDANHDEAATPVTEHQAVTPHVAETQEEWLDITYKQSFDEFDTAFLEWLDDALRTPIKIKRLKDAIKVFEPLHRALYAFIKHHPLTTSVDLVEMGFPIYDAIRTPSPEPTTTPIAVLVRKGLGVIEIRYFDGTTRRRGKPRGMHGAEIRWAVLPANPGNDYTKLINSEFDTASPFVITFPPEDFGKTFYCSMRWENKRGIKGPFSQIYSLIIG
ncbi:MAG: hypothetical protein LBC81_05845 [Tannerellaceae bacterium]|jgi:hypothetical protein|nr:hypothetical protein [Tannerellaceae bacterium]